MVMNEIRRKVMTSKRNGSDQWTFRWQKEIHHRFELVVFIQKKNKEKYSTKKKKKSFFVQNGWRDVLEKIIEMLWEVLNSFCHRNRSFLRLCESFPPSQSNSVDHLWIQRSLFRQWSTLPQHWFSRPKAKKSRSETKSERQRRISPHEPSFSEFLPHLLSIKIHRDRYHTSTDNRKRERERWALINRRSLSINYSKDEVDLSCRCGFVFRCFVICFHCGWSRE